MAKRNRINLAGRKYLVGILLHYLLAFLVLLVITFALRAGMNMLSRAVFITTRLDDYPHLLGNYLSENEEWWGWWQTEDSP